MYECKKATGSSVLPNEKHSTYGRGRIMPDPSKSSKTKEGVEIPLGPIIEHNDLNSELIHNEFAYYYFFNFFN